MDGAGGAGISWIGDSVRRKGRTMDLWLVVPGLVLLSLLYVVLPVAYAMASHYRRPKLVRCPLAREDAAIQVGRAGAAEALGRRALRRVEACSLWPERRACLQSCLDAPEGAIRADGAIA
jgi:hypothetical protein